MIAPQIGRLLPGEQWRRNRLAINLAAGFLFAVWKTLQPDRGAGT